MTRMIYKNGTKGAKEKQESKDVSNPKSETNPKHEEGSDQNRRLERRKSRSGKERLARKWQALLEKGIAEGRVKA
jgi:hypothetical protein